MFKKEKQERTETREEKFKRIAGGRVQKILDKLRLLENCSDKSNYTYTDEQVGKIFKTINDEVKKVESSFKRNTSKKKEFKL